MGLGEGEWRGYGIMGHVGNVAAVLYSVAYGNLLLSIYHTLCVGAYI